MWIVKRMSTAPIVVLTIALGGGAYLANGSGNKPPPTEPVAQLKPVDVHAPSGRRPAPLTGTLSLALNSNSRREDA
jgi:hypothetical protein